MCLEQLQRTSTSTTSLTETQPTSHNGSLNRSSPSPASSPLSPTSPRKPSAPPSPLRSSQMPRSQTVPSLTDAETTPRRTKPTETLKIETKSVPQETLHSEICLSPSWSDHGEKDRKKEKKRQEREQRETEKRKKIELESRTAGKRLSKKPPPAAMETQKMPSELRSSRRNSLVSLISGRSPSQDRAPRSSREEKRLSGTYIASFMPGRRSRSEQRRSSIAPSEDGGRPESIRSIDSWKPIVSPLAPKLPSFRWRSRTESADDSNANSSQGSHEDFVALAYQIDDPEVKRILDPEIVEDKRPQRDVSFEGGFKMKTMDRHARGSTEPTLRSTQRQSPDKQIERSRVPPRNSAGVPASRPPLKTLGSQDSNERKTSAEAAADLIAILGDQEYKPICTPPSPRSPRLHSRPFRDGSSYVHKQRMYQQQRSIAGFEEQEALQLFNEQAAIARMDQSNGNLGSRLPNESNPLPYTESKACRSSSGSRERTPTRQPQNPNRRQSASPSRRMKHPALQAASSPLKTVSQAPESPVEKRDMQGQILTRAGEQIPSNMDQPSQASKTDKILGFRRRGKQTPAPIQVPESANHAPPKVASSNIDRPQEQESVVKRSRMERMSAQIPFRHQRNSSGSQTALNMNGTPENRGHSRTRTSSSQLLNDHVISPIPKTSATHAVIHPQRPSTQAVTRQKDEHKDESKNSAESDRSAEEDATLPSPDSATLAASYAEVIHSPSSIEEATGDEFPGMKAPKDPEMIVKSVNGEGIVRKTSITRPRSNPQLQIQTTSTNPIPSLDFLPQLKHQPLVKFPKRSSTQESAEPSPTKLKISVPTSPASTAYSSPLATPPDLSLMPRSPLRQPNTFNRSTPSVIPFHSGKGPLGEGLDAKPIAKLFVICCKCKFWHDLPSKLYEAMALPKELHRSDEGSGKTGKGGHGAKGIVGAAGVGKGKATLETAVKCPWCEHAMTTWCCAGWTTVVYMHERHH